MQLKQSRFVLGLLLVFVLLMACKDSQLQRLANILDDVADSATFIRTTTAAAHASGFVTAGEVETIGTVMKRVDAGNKLAIQTTRGIAKLDPGTNAKLVDVLTPIIQAVDAAVKDPALAGIKNVKARDDIHFGLVSLEGSLAAAQLIVAAGK